ncbi:MAG: DUF1576 domain-containing protein [Clostridia bacterium]|nr:DUF1576 domain-containing protein [Clostridia bacterium]
MKKAKMQEPIPGVLERRALTGPEARQLRLYGLFWTGLLFFASLVATLIYSDFRETGAGLLRILLSPAKLLTDYFELGGLAATFLNAALCGLACNLFAILTKTKPSALLLAAYFLVISHCFFGLNFLNMWPPFLGVFFCGRLRKLSRGELLPLAMFSTSLGPFVSEFLFRYFQKESFDPTHPTVTLPGVLLTLGFGILAGFLIPALLPGTSKMHRGFSLYKAGLAVGIFGVFAFAFFYKTLGIDNTGPISYYNAHYESFGRSYLLFVNLFFAVAFLLTILWGFFGNKKSFRGYKPLFDCDGWQDDFPIKFGMPRTLINIGFYGICVLIYFNLVILLTEGVGFTGPTTGVIIAAITFGASGQTPKNVWPIALGYMLLLGISSGACTLMGLPILSSLSTQGYLSGLAFATGLCPFTGRYGRRYGVIAGFLSALLCTSTMAMHGGFVLYNGGFAAGLSAMLLIPILDYYKVPEKTHEPGK